MSIQASEWARRQYVGDVHGKALLRAIADYANEDGVCWPSVARLAQDTEISEPGVRRKIKELDAAGFLTKTKTWMDDQGRRNHEGRGRETSSDLRLIMSKTATKPEGESASDGPSSSPSVPYQGDSPHSQADSPPLSGADTLEPSLEKKDSPQPPFRGAFEEKKEKKGKEEPELEIDAWFDRFSAVYPIPITDVPRTKAWARAASGKQREDAITGGRGYAMFLDGERRRGRSRAVKDAHRWLKAEGFTGYIQRAKTADEQAARPLVETGSEAGRAWRALHKIARMSAPIDFNGRYQLSATPSLRFLAFAQAGPHSQWLFIAENKHQQVGAWNSCLGNLLAGKPRGELVSETFKGRGFFAPWPYPPSVEGKIYTSTDAPKPTMTEADEAYIAEHGI